MQSRDKKGPIRVGQSFLDASRFVSTFETVMYYLEKPKAISFLSFSFFTLFDGFFRKMKNVRMLYAVNPYTDKKSECTSLTCWTKLDNPITNHGIIVSNLFRYEFLSILK